MYQDFSIVSITTISSTDRIVVTTSFDIDPETVNEDTVRLYSKHDKSDVILNFEVDNKTITIIPRNTVIKNTDYILRISGIKNVLGTELSSGARRTLKFVSEVREIPDIISPADYEELVDLKVTLKAILEDKNEAAIKDKKYCIQIAEDVAFFNIVLDTKTDKEITNLKDLPAGQYYIRARVEATIQDEIHVGKWSKTVTFISLYTGNTSTPDKDEDDGPTIINNVSLLNKPINGETPESILLEFSGEIDIDRIDNIILIRRDI